MNLVIDASVVIKFYVPEILSDRAQEVMSGVADGKLMLLAPDLLYPETGNILWKKQRLHELTPNEVEEIVDAITSLPIKIEHSRQIMPLSVAIALQTGITVYDAMYAAVAGIYETRMITADRRLVGALEKTEFKNNVQWLGA
ncbi:MAG: type II toxin-antitoxin system VapC family toxin [Deltaproteobacteria bacterium]|nr:type II toxin-antitoxin system VapC family toxin [Deltaproteobacteria bacterium]